MKKELLFECKERTQANDRVIARKLENKYNLIKRLNESEKFYEQNYDKLTHNGKSAILQYENALIEKILSKFDIVVEFKSIPKKHTHKYIVYVLR